MRGRRLAPFRGTRIRPTSDRVREAVFNVIAARVRLEGLKGVLDLFAGTGAMGIEALSRGAEEAVFVDNDKGAVSVIERNIESCGLASRARVFKRTAAEAVRALGALGERFDIIFLDPPYRPSQIEETLEDIRRAGLLNPGGMIIAEGSKREPLETGAVGFELLDVRKYGDTAVYFFGG